LLPPGAKKWCIADCLQPSVIGILFIQLSNVWRCSFGVNSADVNQLAVSGHAGDYVTSDYGVIHR
jgi:hypothetical protein